MTFVRLSPTLLCCALVAGCTQQQNLGDKNGTTHTSDGAISQFIADGGTNDGAGSEQGPAPDLGGTSTGGTHYIVLYGGSDETGSLDDTWVFDGAKWTQQQGTNPGLTAIAGGALYDGKVVMNGAVYDSTSGNSTGATWSWDGSAWTQINGSGPSARDSSAVMTTSNGIVLFGGNDDSGNFSFLTDTWLFDGAHWTQSNAFGPTNGLDWVGASLNGVGWMFQGDGVDSWTGSDWTEAKAISGGPDPDDGAAVASLGSTIVQFGGIADDFNALGDTWTFDGTNWTLHNVDNAPSARGYAGLATLGDKVVLFGGNITGGIDQPNPVFGDTWIFDGTSWTQLNITGPSARAPGLMVGY